MRYIGSFLALGTGAVSLAVSLPAIGQEVGGRTSSFEFDQNVEVVNNPELNPGSANTETLSVSRFAYTLASKTRNDEISLRLQTAYRVPLGGSNVGSGLDETGAYFDYAKRSASTNMSVHASSTYRDLRYLNSFDLDGDDDISRVNGSGGRINNRVSLSGDFRENKAFGWGGTVGASAIRYSDLSAGSTYVDADRYNASLRARFDLNNRTRLSTRFGLRETQEVGNQSFKTYSADIGMNYARPTGELRSALSFAWPDGSPDRVSFTVGQTYNFSPRSQISYDVGGTFSSGDDTNLTGQVEFSYDITKTSQASANFSRQVSDADDGSAVVRTIGQFGYGMALSPLTQLSMDLRYLDRDTLGSTDDMKEYGVSVSVQHRLTDDWNLDLGVSHTTRNEFGQATADSNSVFVALKRVWKAKHR